MGALVQVDVLGPLRVRDVGGTDRTPDGGLQRRLLALLVLHRGTVVSAEACIDALWPTRMPKDPGAALQTHVFRLRRSLPDLIESTDLGYRLDPSAVELDADRLARGVDDADLDALEEVLDRWRGPAYPELDELDAGRIEAERLEELRLRAVERRAALRLAAGDADEAAAQLRALVTEHPLRERPRALLVDALAASGRVSEALRAYDDFRRVLADELGIEPSAAFTARHAELLAGEARSTEWKPAHRLPAAATSILGRDDVLADAEAQVAEHRLVTLLGFGGIGKTRLLLELGHRLRESAPDRPVVFVELAAATPESAVDAVLTALGIEGRRGLGMNEVLVQALAEVELVLLLDNCEHVLDPVASLAEQLLAGAPGVRMVTTTRERLRVAGERLLPVPPLRSADLDDDAERLFVERARAVVPDFQPNEEERAVIAEIVRRLDGLPLAIELAAARLLSLDVDEIAAGLDHRFGLLATGARTATRHRSLGAAVAWSVGLLDERLRATFLDLSVFAGSFSVDDAAAVSDLDVATAADAIGQLTERSLVLRLPDRRYLLLETLRQFGVEEIDAGRHPAAARARHAQHVLETVVAADEALTGREGRGAILEIESLLPELRAALDWFIDHGDFDGAGLMVRSIEAYGFYRLRPDVLRLALRVAEADVDGNGPHAPAVWAVASLAVWMDGDLKAVRATATQGLAIAERDGTPPPPILESALGSLFMFEGRLDDAIEWYRRAWEHAEHLGRRLVNIGTEVLSRSYAGDPTALAIAEFGLGEADGVEGPQAAMVWYCAGEADLRHDLDRARTRFTRAIELGERCDATFVTGVAGTSLASIDARIGDPAEAAAAYRRLIGHWRRAGAWSTQWTMLRWVAVVIEKLGRVREAAVLVGAILATEEGNRIFGDDEVLIAELQSRLRSALGDADYESAIAEGGVLDGDGTVEHALRSLEGTVLAATSTG